MEDRSWRLQVLCRSYVFGEEPNGEWGRKVLATARERRVSADPVILEAGQEARARPRRDPAGETLARRCRRAGMTALVRALYL